MLRQNHTSGCLLCHNSTIKNPQTCWRHNGWGAPPLKGRREPTPEPTLPQPGMPPAPTSNNAGTQCSQIVNLPARYVYFHTSLPWAEFFNHDAAAQDSQHNTDFDPDTLTDKGTSTGWYTICCVVMQLTSILKIGAAYWANLQAMTSIDRKAPHFGDWYYMWLCIIKEQCSDQEENKWKYYKDCQCNVNDRLWEIKWLHIVDSPMTTWASTEHKQFLVM